MWKTQSRSFLGVITPSTVQSVCWNLSSNGSIVYKIPNLTRACRSKPFFTGSSPESMRPSPWFLAYPASLRRRTSHTHALK
jgi:hypothetical protein